MNENLVRDAMSLNLELLAAELRNAATLVSEARAAMDGGQRNRAIGTVLPLEQTLPEMASLLATTIALRRRAGRRA